MGKVPAPVNGAPAARRAGYSHNFRNLRLPSGIMSPGENAI